MAERKIIWTRTADKQLLGILEYWLHRNKSNRFPIKLNNLVKERTIQISKTPLQYKKTNFNNIRVASLGNYSIYFRSTESEIFIMAFWDNRQDPKKLIELLGK